MAQPELVLVRGSSEEPVNRQFGPQTIKNLRALEGELTHLNLDRSRIDDGALVLLDELRAGSRSRITCAVVYVDDERRSGFALRAGDIYRCEEQDGRLELFIDLQSFFTGAPPGTDAGAQWAGALDGFAAPYLVTRRPEWPECEPVPYADSLDAWHRAVDFMVTHWPDSFEGCAFLRLESADLPDGLELSGYTNPADEAYVWGGAMQGREFDLDVYSYNPHIGRDQLGRLKLDISTAHVIDVVSGNGEPLDRDGRMTVRVRVHQPGEVGIKISVHPRNYLHTQFDVRFEVDRAMNSGGVTSVVLGSHWQRCLRSIDDALDGEPKGHVAVLKAISEAFPKDSTVLMHLGQALRREGDPERALEIFHQSLDLYPSDATKVAALLANLELGNVPAVKRLAQGLDIPFDMMDDVLSTVLGLPEPTARQFLPIGLKLVGDVKLQPFIDAARAVIVSVNGNRELVNQLRNGHPAESLDLLVAIVADHPDWSWPRRLLIDLAIEQERKDVVKAHMDLLRERDQRSADELVAVLQAIRGWLPYGDWLSICFEHVKTLTLQPTGPAVGIKLALDVAMEAFAHNDLTAVKRARAAIYASLPRLGDTEREELEDAAEDLEEALALATESGHGADSAKAGETAAPVRFRSVEAAVSHAHANLRNLVFHPKALRTKSHYPLPRRVYEDLEALDSLVARWRRNEVPAGFEAAARQAGLNWADDISDTARTQFRRDYEITLEDGTRVLLGPHIRRGDNYRIYLFVDRKTKSVVVGYIGVHLRDQSNAA
jgi:tetratricopeptide (TPR) repeat protein